MFPDFLKTKENLQKMLDQEMKKARLLHMGPLANVPESMIFEGDKTVVVREDGSIDEENLESTTVKLEVKFEEVEKMNHEMVLDKINRAAEEMASKMAKLFYERLTESAEEVGNVVSAGGEPFSIDLFFEMLEKIHVDFDEEGNPIQLMCPVNPKLLPSIAETISQAKADPANDRRFEAIIERKREEWRVRESNRKLVG
jgi:hypothetical protein